METITAIRCENIEDGCGMFTSYDQFDNGRTFNPYVEELTDLSIRHNQFHTPFEDGFKHTNNHFCAYHSIEQFKTWVFHEELQYLVSVGFRVYELTLSECFVGRDNIVFKKEYILTKIDITDQILSSYDHNNLVEWEKSGEF